MLKNNSFFTDPFAKEPKFLGWVGLPTQRYLHKTLRSGDVATLLGLLTKICRERQQDFLSIEEYKRLLIGRNEKGFTLFDEAVNSSGIDKLQIYLGAMTQAIEERWLSIGEYKELLIGRNKLGYTLLDKLCVYLGAVLEAITKGWTSIEEYKALLTGPNYAGLTPLHYAANSNSLEICKFFVTQLENTAVLTELLWYQNNKGDIPCCTQNKEQATQINEFLAQKRREYFALNNTLYTSQVNGATYYFNTQPIYYQQPNGNSCGSFFKNPIINAGKAEQLKLKYPKLVAYPQSGGQMKLAAGWLIERTHWKGKRVGNVGMHVQQALVLVNYKNASQSEVLAFAAQVQASVLAKFGVPLEIEPVTVVS